MHEYLQSIDWDLIKTQALLWSGKLALALLVFWVGKWLARRFANLLERLVGRSGADPLIAGFARNLGFGIGLAIVLIATLELVGIPNASLLTALGAAGLAIGLALQGSLSNIASGVLLIIFRPFSVGNFVEVAGQSGNVESVTLLFTKLRMPDNRQVTIPNAEVMDSPIVNFSAQTTRRIDLTIGVGYQHDPKDALAVISKVLNEEPRLLSEPAPQLWVMNLGESSVDLAVRPWVRAEEYWAVRSDLLRDIKMALDGAGIEIPFPQRTMHMARPAPADGQG
ncbi:mechanosensitive ion channel family protein [Pseudomarimonas salicorniae]|uniref:Small-conductance mechanosensitive channel n=1 Tax=Pseudomarimonas salicorniae TaxID=2933270 RepID=A0ABT0GID0_9GAMM|nr:mechanosensitive ion channel family protein [Lysobacter sp. CAU 1642]MCK7594310.1 mechanosensitive ion channel family protein [Lysobacter sp. CAU 1642]